MSDGRNFRVILDLNRFFHDHRRTARVFIKHCKTVKDLQNRISEIFGIDGFYVATSGQFLPASEDIRVLHDDETVCVIPDTLPIYTEHSKHKVSSSMKHHGNENKHKKVLDNITEESDVSSMTPDTSATSTKHSKHKVSSSTQRHSIENKQQKRLLEHVSGESDVVSLEDQSPQKKKKVKRSKDNKNCSFESQASCSKSATNNTTSQQSIVEKEICHIETANKISEIKKNLKRKSGEILSRQSNISTADKPSGSKAVLTKLKDYIKSCSIPSTPTLPDTVRLSRHVDTPLKPTKYVPPQLNTDQYLARNRINIVRIDVVKENTTESNNSGISDVQNMKENGTSTGSIIDPESPPQNYVKTVVNSLEKIISPNAKTESTALEHNQHEASNYTKIYLDQKDANEPNILKSKIHSEKTNTDSPNTSIRSNYNAALKRKISGLGSLVNYLKESSDSPLSQESKIHSEKHDTPNTSIESSNNAALKRRISSVGSLVSDLKESDSVFSQESDVYIVEKASTDTPNTSIEYFSNAALKQKTSSLGSLVNDLKESDSLISQESDACIVEIKNTDTPNTSIDCIANAALKQKISNVDLKESDSMFSQESDASSQYVTKRKRVRRKRQSKNKNKNQEAEPTFITPTPKPIISESCPKMHIRFEDSKEDVTEEKMDVIQDVLEDKLNNSEKDEGCQEANNSMKTENAAELLSAPEVVFLSDENEDPIMENKSIFGREYILNAPLMGNKLQPKVGDIIAFKVLKLTENYSPQLSDYVVGKVEMYVLESKTVYFKILNGEQELLPPTGKLSLDLTDKENNQNSKYEKFIWSEILEPKLLYP